MLHLWRVWPAHEHEVTEAAAAPGKPTLPHAFMTSDVMRPVRELSRESGNVSNEGRVTVKVKFTLEQAMKAQRGSRGIALLFL